MIGIVLAIVLLICKADTNTVLLAMIAGELLGINFEIAWHRSRIQRKDKAVSEMLIGIARGIAGEESEHGRDGDRNDPAGSDPSDGR